MPIETPTAPAPTTSLPSPSAPAFADFDAAFPDDGVDTPAPAPEPQPKTEPAPTAPATAPKPDAPKPKTDAPAPKDKPAEAPKPEPQEDLGPEYTPPSVAKPSELRGWALRQAKKAKAAAEERDQLAQRIRQLESQPSKPMQDNSAMAAQLAEAQKKLERYENDLRLTKFERSQEYRDKYEQPRVQAEAAAARDLKELTVFEPNPEDPENPRERPATAADFEQVYQLPLGKATQLANKMFGSAASIVLQHRANIKGLYEASFRAVEEHKGKGAELEKQQQAQRAQYEQGMGALFNQAKEFHAKKNAELYAEKAGDTEANELLAKGRQFADQVFGGTDGMTPQQIAMRDAAAYNRLSAFPRVMASLKKLTAENAELKATIEGIRSSSPGKPEPVTGGQVKVNGTWEEEFDRQVK